jgi:hypothetical protein
MPNEFQLLVYILHFLGVEMTDWMNLLCWCMFIINAMRYCSERTTLHCVESYLYYIILVNSETRDKINRQYTYIVENIKFIYTSFDEFSLPVSQRMEMNYIFSDNIHILYLSWYVKSPKETVKLSKKSRNKRRSYRFWLCPLEVRASKHKCCHGFLPSLNMNQVPENYILVNNQL